MMRKVLLPLAAYLSITSFAIGQSASSFPLAQARCAQLASVSLDHAKITSATFVAAANKVSGVVLSVPRIQSLPAFCRVKVTDQPSNDSDTQIEIWLPAERWNGRYRGQGNGGFAGEIGYDLMAASLSQGYATSGTDAGHAGHDPTFALGHPEKVKDFGWRAVHDMTVESKVIAAAFYGKPPQYSYFSSCSDGGREALMEAQRFPADYDGILAGAPANNWTGLLSAGTADDQSLMAKPASYIPAGKIPAIANAVRATCDSQDGLNDGVLADPRDCKFDPAMLACKHGDADNCLMPDQIATLKTIYGTKFDAQGRQVFPGYLPGAEDAKGGWVGWIVGNAPGDSTLMMFFGVGYFANFVHEQADWSLKSFNFDRDLKLANSKTASALNATDTNLRPFLSRGGRLIMYHGWDDPAIPALSTVSYYNGLVATLGEKTMDSDVRLYMVPGMLHCGGGPGVTSFGQNGDEARADAQHDIFTALEQWVEAKKTPGQLTAEKFVEDDPKKGVVMTRPLCPYPAEAHYIPGADSKNVNGFVCAVKAR